MKKILIIDIVSAVCIVVARVLVAYGIPYGFIIGLFSGLIRAWIYYKKDTIPGVYLTLFLAGSDLLGTIHNFLKN
jgi:hypothetical protein